MSNFRSNNSKSPQMSQFTQQIRPKRRSMSIYGQIDGPFHSDLSQSCCGSSWLFEPRKQRRGGGSRFSIATPVYNGYRLSQNSANGPCAVNVWFWSIALGLAVIVSLIDFT